MPLLKREVPAFTASDEYRVHQGQIDDLPGVVLATLGKFLSRRAATDPTSPTLRAGLDVICEMLTWDDSRVTDGIHVEFFEVIQDHSATETVLTSLMSTPLLQDYQRWCE